MEFPSLEFVKSLQERLNAKGEFNKASKWSDVKVLLCLGDKRYYMKLYGGKVIDVREYFPPYSVPLGWDFSISGPLETWQDYINGKLTFGHLLQGRVIIDGNLLEANRMHDAVQLIVTMIPEVAKSRK